jgi:hypothetical protein
LIFGRSCATARKRAEHAGGAAHVELHLVHLGRRLDRDAAGVEGDALAHQHHGRRRLRRAAVAQHDELQRLCRALRHGQQAAHAKFLGLLAVQHLDLQFVRLRQALRFVGQDFWRAVVARPVGELARQRHPGGDRLAALQRRVQHGGIGLGASQHHLLQLGCGRRRRLGVAVDVQRLVHRHRQYLRRCAVQRLR